MNRRAFVLLAGAALAGCSGGGSGRSTAAKAALRNRAEAALAADDAWAESARGIEIEWYTDGYRIRVEYDLAFEPEQSPEAVKERADATAILVLGRLFEGEEPINRATVVGFADADPDPGDGTPTERATAVHLARVTGVTASAVAWEGLEPGELEERTDAYDFEARHFR